MVLVDTSVWIRFLANQSPYAQDLSELLAQDRVVGHDLVYGEMLSGDNGGRRLFLMSYERISQAAVVPHSEVVAFVKTRRLHGRGVGWIDLHLLASALVGSFQLWTGDLRLAVLAQELGVAYAGSGQARAH